MSRAENKTQRLLQMEALLLSHPEGLTQSEIARHLGVDRSVIHRNLYDFGKLYPVIEHEDGRVSLDRSSYLVKVAFTLHEAMGVHLASRLLATRMDKHNPHAASALRKLGIALEKLAPRISAHVKQSADVMDEADQRQDPRYLDVLEKLTLAWAELKKVKVWHRSDKSGRVFEYMISPYFIEPYAVGQTTHIIGRDAGSGKMRTLKIERIERVEIQQKEQYEIPAEFDPRDLLADAWGIWYTENEPVEVVLKFHRNVAQRLQETRWHRSEEETELQDGSILWKAKVAEPQEMVPWIRAWGSDCEVLEPKELREALAREAQELAELYQVMEMKKELFAHFREVDKDHKAPQYLWEHLTKVSKDAGQFASKIGLQKSGEVLGLLHDLGKASEKFQRYLLSGEGLIDPDEDGYINYKAMKGKIDHSTAGAQVIFERLKNSGHEGRIVAQGLALCIASHHSGLIDCLSPDGTNNFQNRIEGAEDRTHKNESSENMREILKLLDDDLLKDAQKEFLQTINRLIEDGDSDQTKAFKEGLFLRFLLSCLLDADRLDTADFENPSNTRLRNFGEYHSWGILIERLNLNLNEFSKKENKNEVDELRDQISKACYEFSTKPKGVYQLTVPTGGGKTLASLRFALNHAAHHTKSDNRIERIFYIIPYTSIIDQNAAEIRKILEDRDENGKLLDKVVLEHHSNLTPDEETRRQNLLAQNWDAPIVFTTQVQFLEALFGSGTRSARRMHQLANSVIIFDEIQTLPIKCLHMFNMATRFLVRNCGTSVVLCTATQPPLDQVGSSHRALSAQPIIQNPAELFKKLKRVQVLDERGINPKTDIEIADLAEQELHKKGSVLIVVNTKKSAHALYQAIADRKIPCIHLYHLSTNMCPAHRLKVLNKIKGKLKSKIAKPVICISTQLIEAGVDIDFGSVIRYLAGLDSITQAAGRCNRNGNQKDKDGKPALGRVLIVERENEKTDRLIDITIGIEQSKRILGQFKAHPEKFEDDIIGLSAIAEYYKWYFSKQGGDKMKYEVGKKSFIGRQDNLFNVLSENKQAIQAHDGNVDIFFKQSFLSAAKSFEVIDSKTQGVIVPYGKEGAEIIEELKKLRDVEKRYLLLKRAQKYSINLYSEKFNQLRENGVIQEIQKDLGIYYMEKIYYDEKQLGWIEDPFMEV